MHPQWWLIGLSFALGLVLTFALMIRRVKSEVPVSTSAPAASTAGFAGGRSGAESEAPTTKTAAGGEAATPKTATGGDAPTTKSAAGGDAPTTKVPPADEDEGDSWSDSKSQP